MMFRYAYSLLEYQLFKWNFYLIDSDNVLFVLKAEIAIDSLLPSIIYFQNPLSLPIKHANYP